MTKIDLSLHCDENNSLTLDFQDVLEELSENDEEDVEFAHYAEKYCQYLNYFTCHNRELAVLDADYARLDGWINGYNMAKRAIISEVKGKILVKIKIRKKTFHISFPKPIAI